MIIPKNLKNNLVSTTEEEITAYYSLTCVRDADYDFTEQINKILTEYMNLGINIPNDETGNKKRLYKSQLKKMILVDRPKNSKKFDVFNQWRLARINFYKNRRKDQFIEMKNIDISPPARAENNDEKDKIIEKLMKENKELKQRLNQYETKPIMRTIETQTETETENPKSYYEEDDGYLEDTDEEEDTAEESEEEDTDEESEEESEEEDTDEETPKITNPQQKRNCIQKFNEVCKSKMKPYLDQYEKEKENMNQKQIEQLQKQIRDKFVSEIVEPERDNFDRFVELSFKEYNEIVYKPADKIMDEMLYQ